MKITDVRVLPGDSGFLIDDGKTSILYDTGFAFTGERLAQNVQKILKNRSILLKNQNTFAFLFDII